MGNVKPISPSQAVKDDFPDEVIEAFNEILKNDGKNSITIKQKDVLELIIQKFKDKGEDIDSGYIFNNNFLDVEDLYRNAGWEVTYDKPAYYESYEASFTFRKSKK